MREAPDHDEDVPTSRAQRAVRRYLHPRAARPARRAGGHRHLPRPPGRPRDHPRAPARRRRHHPQHWRARQPGGHQRQAAPMTSSRRLVSSGSPLEPEIGFSRALRAGPYICVAGTAPIAESGGTASPGDVYAQSVRCLDLAEQAPQEAGASLADVVRTRVMLTDIRQWRQAARAHAQRFAQVRPVTTFIEMSRFIDPEWLVEFELDAIVPD